MAGVAYAVVRYDPPEVFVAEDIDVLHRVLAMELVARTEPGELTEPEREELRTALLEERWADAVLVWMRLRQVEVDVYTYLHVYEQSELPSDLIGAQLQFARLFRDG